MLITEQQTTNELHHSQHGPSQQSSLLPTLPSLFGWIDHSFFHKFVKSITIENEPTTKPIKQIQNRIHRSFLPSILPSFYSSTHQYQLDASTSLSVLSCRSYLDLLRTNLIDTNSPWCSDGSTPCRNTTTTIVIGTSRLSA